jgi:hypothetical protein
VEDFKNELLQLARTKLGNPAITGSTRVDPDAYKLYVQQLLNSFAASTAR